MGEGLSAVWFGWLGMDLEDGGTLIGWRVVTWKFVLFGEIDAKGMRGPRHSFATDILISVVRVDTNSPQYRLTSRLQCVGMNSIVVLICFSRASGLGEASIVPRIHGIPRLGSCQVTQGEFHSSNDKHNFRQI